MSNDEGDTGSAVTDALAGSDAGATDETVVAGTITEPTPTLEDDDGVEVRAGESDVGVDIDVAVTPAPTTLPLEIGCGLANPTGAPAADNDPAVCGGGSTCSDQHSHHGRVIGA